MCGNVEPTRVYPFHTYMSEVVSSSFEFGLVHCYKWGCQSKTKSRIANRLESEEMVYPSHLDLRCLAKLRSAQPTHNIKMTSYQRRCDVITSYRRWYDVILTLCAHWEVTVTYTIHTWLHVIQQTTNWYFSFIHLHPLHKRGFNISYNFLHEMSNPVL